MTMNCKAYWIHVNGEVIPAPTIHIAVVISNPEQFGYTRERIEAEYSVCNEPVGHEGKARQAIMGDLIRNHGWIRVRYTPRYDSWVVELNTLTVSVRLLLARFFSNPEIIGAAHNATVRITEFSSAEGVVRHHNTSVNGELYFARHEIEHLLM